MSNLTIKIRKSSCVNARGIPTAGYQVLHLLPEVGTPQPGLTGGGTRWGPPGRSTPQPGLMGRLVLEVGPPPPWQGYLLGQVQWGGGVPEVGYMPSRSDLGGVLPPSGPGRGTPPPRCGQTDGQTRVKT